MSERSTPPRRRPPPLRPEVQVADAPAPGSPTMLTWAERWVRAILEGLSPDQKTDEAA